MERKCVKDNCTSKAEYNYEGFRKGVMCQHHRTSRMFNINVMAHFKPIPVFQPYKMKQIKK